MGLRTLGPSGYNGLGFSLEPAALNGQDGIVTGALSTKPPPSFP